MKLCMLMLLLTLSAVSVQSPYQYTLDLKNVVDDKIKVTVHCPKIKESEAVFVMPRVIPGSYSWKEYGRFLSNVKAFDASGASIKITNKKNIFYIKEKADQLARLEYWVSDTWDDLNTSQFIFQPGGSNIEAGKNFVINHHAFVGYFEGYKQLPFEVEIIKPDFMYGATWLKKEVLSPEKDLIKADSYDMLADNPVMYCKPDTASFVVDNARIYVTSYSHKGLVKADSLRIWLQPMALALKNFMGKLPVSEYHFMFYFASPDQLPKGPEAKGLSGFGALEHNHSSFYFLQEQAESESVKEMVQDVGSHEFLHILAPLNLHSKEIADFNFRDPKMSQHLWLYEGVTEYFSWLVRVQNGLVTEDEFMKEMTLKLKRADQFKPFSFTEMSKNVLQSKNQENYTNVYQKGAVIAMMLDQLLIKQSGGTYSLKHLMTDLMKKYGAKQAFDDEQLFSDIVALTYPEVGTFIEEYIKGMKPLPLANSMADFGYEYLAQQRVTSYYIGSFGIKLNEKSQVEIIEVKESLIGMQDGDVLLAVDKTNVTLDKLDEIWDRYFMYNPYPNELRIKLLRNGVEIEKFGKPLAGYRQKKHVLMKSGSPGKDEQLLHDKWLKASTTNE